MIKRFATTIAATAACVLVFGNPSFATPPDCHGIAVSDPANDHYIGVSATGALVHPTAAIDITGVYLTGPAGAEKLNIRVQDLTASPNVEYTFRWNDPVSFGQWYELSALFTTSSGAYGSGFYTFTHGSSSSSVLMATTGRTFTGPNGVVQIDLRWDQTAWPTTFTGLSARAEQYEGNSVFLNVPPVRTDTASASSWTQPC
jgi:hypothetical protein